jgi:hypothetical protein
MQHLQLRVGRDRPAVARGPECRERLVGGQRPGLLPEVDPDSTEQSTVVGHVPVPQNFKTLCPYAIQRRSNGLVR